MAEALPNRASIFISYSRRDADFVRLLHAAFEGAGRKAWLDQDDIRPVAKWASEIAVAIDHSDVIVFVLSPDFVASEECTKEIRHAAAQNKRLIPVKARAIDLEDFDAQMQGFHAVSLALNSLNRSMGLPDAYPFAVPPAARSKLEFVHRLIAEER